MTAAVDEVVHRQIEVGIDVLNDGEQGKPDYSTYIQGRLTGRRVPHHMYSNSTRVSSGQLASPSGRK